MHLVGILFPHINEDARSKSHQKQISIQRKSKARPLQIPVVAEG